MASHVKTDLVLDALKMATEQRTAEGVIHHSDQGSQYTSFRFGARCQSLKIRQSMVSVSGQLHWDIISHNYSCLK